MFYDHETTAPLPALPGVSSRAVGLSTNRWDKLADRQAGYKINSDQPLDLCAYLFTDLTSSPQAVVVPPNVSVEVELHPNLPQKSIILSEIGNTEPVVCVHMASLIVPRVTPAHSVPRSIHHQFMRVSAQPVFIPKNATNYHGIVTFSGPIPSRLTLLFASMDSFDGNYASNMYSSQPRNVKKIDFNVAGKIYPTSPIEANFATNELSEIYLRTAESLRFSLDRTQLSLPSMETYGLDEFIYSADISDDYSTDSTWTTSAEDTGSVAISLHFGEKTPDQVVAILIAESVSTLKITQNGEVQIE
jgi:hypothetical protein